MNIQINSERNRVTIPHNAIAMVSRCYNEKIESFRELLKENKIKVIAGKDLYSKGNFFKQFFIRSKFVNDQLDEASALYLDKTNKALFFVTPYASVRLANARTEEISKNIESVLDTLGFSKDGDIYYFLENGCDNKALAMQINISDIGTSYLEDPKKNADWMSDTLKMSSLIRTNLHHNGTDSSQDMEFNISSDALGNISKYTPEYLERKKNKTIVPVKSNKKNTPKDSAKSSDELADQTSAFNYVYNCVEKHPIAASFGALVGGASIMSGAAIILASPFLGITSIPMLITAVPLFAIPTMMLTGTDGLVAYGFGATIGASGVKSYKFLFSAPAGRDVIAEGSDNPGALEDGSDNLDYGDTFPDNSSIDGGLSAQERSAAQNNSQRRGSVPDILPTAADGALEKIGDAGLRSSQQALNRFVSSRAPAGRGGGRAGRGFTPGAGASQSAVTFATPSSDSSFSSGSSASRYLDIRSLGERTEIASSSQDSFNQDNVDIFYIPGGINTPIGCQVSELKLSHFAEESIIDTVLFDSIRKRTPADIAANDHLGAQEINAAIKILKALANTLKSKGYDLRATTIASAVDTISQADILGLGSTQLQTAKKIVQFLLPQNHREDNGDFADRMIGNGVTPSKASQKRDGAPHTVAKKRAADGQEKSSAAASSSSSYGVTTTPSARQKKVSTPYPGKEMPIDSNEEEVSSPAVSSSSSSSVVSAAASSRSSSSASKPAKSSKRTVTKHKQTPSSKKVTYKPASSEESAMILEESSRSASKAKVVITKQKPSRKSTQMVLEEGYHQTSSSSSSSSSSASTQMMVDKADMIDLSKVQFRDLPEGFYPGTTEIQTKVLTKLENGKEVTDNDLKEFYPNGSQLRKDFIKYATDTKANGVYNRFLLYQYAKNTNYLNNIRVKNIVYSGGSDRVKAMIALFVAANLCTAQGMSTDNDLFHHFSSELSLAAISSLALKNNQTNITLSVANYDNITWGDITDEERNLHQQDSLEEEADDLELVVPVEFNGIASSEKIEENLQQPEQRSQLELTSSSQNLKWIADLSLTVSSISQGKSAVAMQSTLVAYNYVWNFAQTGLLPDSDQLSQDALVITKLAAYNVVSSVLVPVVDYVGACIGVPAGLGDGIAQGLYYSGALDVLDDLFA